MLSWTSYGRLAKAASSVAAGGDPRQLDAVLERIGRELKFHCETVRFRCGTPAPLRISSLLPFHFHFFLKPCLCFCISASSYLTLLVGPFRPVAPCDPIVRVLSALLTVTMRSLIVTTCSQLTTPEIEASWARRSPTGRSFPGRSPASSTRSSPTPRSKRCPARRSTYVPSALPHKTSPIYHSLLICLLSYTLACPSPRPNTGPAPRGARAPHETSGARRARHAPRARTLALGLRRDTGRRAPLRRRPARAPRRAPARRGTSKGHAG